MELKIITFNLKSDTHKHSRHPWMGRLGAVKMFMDKYKPDLVGTQELTIEAISDMVELLPGYQWIGLGRNGAHRGEFTAIFYNTNKLVCEAEDTFWLGKRPAVEGSRLWHAAYPRTCTWGIFQELNGNNHVAVYNTHLDHFSPWARKNGIMQIGNFIKQMNTGYPTVLMGDFNALPQSWAIKALKELNARYDLFCGHNVSTFVSDNSIGRTRHGFTGKVKGKPIDYIFTSPDISVKQVKVDRNRYKGRYPSDHYPIVMKAHIGVGTNGNC